LRALIVDDEPAVRDSLRRVLRAERYDVDTASDGPEALAKIAHVAPDVVILDVLMPEMSGLEVCRQMRVAGNWTPVLMLTAREAVSDRVAGLEAGADDYLPKPFALEELLARLRALLRRSSSDGSSLQLSFGDLTLDLRTRRAERGGDVIDLTRTEYRLLELFLRNPRQVLTRTTIFERVWGVDLSESSNSLGVYIGYLRRKTEAAGRPRLIHTVHGVGYALRES
jgi:two-component system response regulator MprA